MIRWEVMPDGDALFAAGEQWLAVPAADMAQRSTLWLASALYVQLGCSPGRAARAVFAARDALANPNRPRTGRVA